MTSFPPKMTPRSAPRPTGSGTSRPAASPVLSLSKGRSAENCLRRCEYSRTFAGSRTRARVGPLRFARFGFSSHAQPGANFDNVRASARDESSHRDGGRSNMNVWVIRR